MTERYITYYRVSTARQGRSGLGLEAQEHHARELISSNAGDQIGSYTDVETGKSADRPKLRAALVHARRSGATLLIAKLDRLSRNVAFLSALMDSGVPFVCCDNPHATRLTLHILAAIAEHEAKMISQRTKEALAAAKRRGVKLGSARPGHWAGREEARLKGVRKAITASVAARRKRSRQFLEEICERILVLHRSGLSLRAIAERLNHEQFWTCRGRPWHPVYVHRFLQRAKQLKQS